MSWHVYFMLSLIICAYPFYKCITWTVYCILLAIFLQIPHLRPTEYKRSRLPRNRRTVNRPYGGVLAGGAVRERFPLTSLHNHNMKSLFSTSYVIILCLFWCELHVPFPSSESSALSWLKNRRLWRMYWRFKRQRKSSLQSRMSVKAYFFWS